jgi:hypothetical protein
MDFLDTECQGVGLNQERFTCKDLYKQKTQGKTLRLNMYCVWLKQISD